MKVERIQPAYNQVASQIRELILSGELAPGEKLPNETDLAELFGVSRSTVREALRTLASRDLISTQRGVTGGSFIAKLEPDHIASYLETSFSLLSGTRVVSVNELLEARSLLEVPAARLAAERHNADDLERIRRALEDERDSLETAFEGHRQFHSSVLRATGNGLLEIMTRPIFTTLRTRFLRDRAPRAFWTTVFEDHAEILRLIESRDAERAGQAMQVHLDYLRATYEEIDSLMATDLSVEDKE